jgi:hypothetical protein
MFDVSSEIGQQNFEAQIGQARMAVAKYHEALGDLTDKIKGDVNSTPDEKIQTLRDKASQMSDQYFSGFAPRVMNRIMYRPEDVLSHYEENIRSDDTQAKAQIALGQVTQAQGLSALVNGIASDDTLSPEQKVESFRDQASNLRNTLLDNNLIPDSLKTHFQVSLEIGATKAEVDLRNIMTKQANDKAAADTLSAINILGQDPTLSAQQKITYFDQLPHDAFNAVDWEQAREKFKTEVSKEQVSSLFNGIDKLNPQAALQKYRDIRTALSSRNDDNSFTYLPDLDLKDRNSFIQTVDAKEAQMINDIAQQQREAQRIRNENARNLYESFKDLTDQGAFNPKDAAQVGAAVSGTPYERNFAFLLRNVTSMQWRDQQVAKNGIKFLANYYGIPMPDINVFQPLGPQIQYRKAAVDAVFQKTGLRLSPFTPGETTAFADMAKSQRSTPGNVVALAQSIVGGFGPQDAKLIADQYAASDNPELGAILNLVASGDHTTAQNVADGQRLISKSNGKSLYDIAQGTQKSMDEYFDSLSGDAFAAAATARGTYKTAVDTVYTSLAADKGVAPTTFNKDLYDRAFSTVVGPVAKVGGARVLPPAGMSTNNFLNYVRSMNGATIGAMGGTKAFSNEEAAQLIRYGEAKLRTAGNGKYYVEYNNTYLARPTGGRFVLDATVPIVPGPPPRLELPAQDYLGGY